MDISTEEVDQMRSRLVGAVKRYPLATFVILAYLFSWWPLLLYTLGSSPIEVAAFGPFLAALVVLSVTEGRAAVKAWLVQMVRWRVGLRWYAVAFGLPVLLVGIATYLNVRLGAPAPTAEQLGDWPNVFILFPIMLIVPGLGGAWEEPGWRGYATNRLEQGRSRLWALAPLWAMIVVWHLPLFVTGNIEWADVFNMMGGVVIYNWLYHRSGKSVLLVMIIHAVNNAVSGEFFSPMFTGVYSAQLAWLRTLLWGLAALLVLVSAWKWWTADTKPVAAGAGLALGPSS
jgi:membrane protease YdiL (CAAX protease family)